MVMELLSDLKYYLRTTPRLIAPCRTWWDGGRTRRTVARRILPTTRRCWRRLPAASPAAADNWIFHNLATIYAGCVKGIESSTYPVVNFTYLSILSPARNPQGPNPLTSHSDLQAKTTLETHPVVWRSEKAARALVADQGTRSPIPVAQLKRLYIENRSIKRLITMFFSGRDVSDLSLLFACPWFITNV